MTIYLAECTETRELHSQIGDTFCHFPAQVSNKKEVDMTCIMEQNAVKLENHRESK